MVAFQDIIRGFLDSKLRNGRVADKKRNCNSSVNDNRQVGENGECRVATLVTPDQQQRDVEYLKATLVNDENMTVIKQKLRSTSSYRLKMMDTLELDLLETFPYFFTHSSLVNTSFF